MARFPHLTELTLEQIEADAAWETGACVDAAGERRSPSAQKATIPTLGKGAPPSGAADTAPPLVPEVTPSQGAHDKGR
jgi:hypothetical protein